MFTAHTSQVWRFKLTVDQTPPDALHPSGQSDERIFGSRRMQREHALAKEAATQSHSIQSTYKRVTLPHFYAPCQAALMETAVGCNHVAAQPCATLPVAAADLAARTDDLVKRPVESGTVSVAVDQRAHAVTDVDLFGKDDEAVHRAEPQNLISLLESIPWKDAMAVGQHQPVYTQVATYSQQTVRFSGMRIGKSETVLIQLPDRHLSLLFLRYRHGPALQTRCRASTAASVRGLSRGPSRGHHILS